MVDLPGSFHLQSTSYLTSAKSLPTVGAYPDFESLIKNPNTNRLLEVRRSPISMLSMIIVFLFSVVGSFLLISFLQGSFLSQLPIIRNFSPRLFGLIPIVLLLEILRRLHNDIYRFSLHRLTHIRGQFSFSYNVPVVKYVDIRAINVIQDFWGRIFGYGDISVGTAAHDGNEILISGVREPETLAMLLDTLRSYSLKIESSEIRKEFNTSTTD